MPENTTNSKQKTFFWSHGGPTFMYKTPKDDNGADTPYNYVKKFGKQVKNEFNPKYLVVVSAHWQPRYNGPESMNKAYVAAPKGLNEVQDKQEKIRNELIYDFYNFPKHMYEEEFESYITRELVEKIESFGDENLSIERQERGIDHGVWVPGKVAELDQYKNKEDFIPIVQLSILPNIPNGQGEDERLNGNVKVAETFNDHITKLGPVIRKINEDGGLVILSGMSVHNLSIFKKVIAEGKKLTFPKEFNQYLKKIITDDKEKKDNHAELKRNILGLGKENTDELLKLFEAHSPEIDHFLPFVIGIGAISDDEYITELFNAEQFSLGWGVYQFGN